MTGFSVNMGGATTMAEVYEMLRQTFPGNAPAEWIDQMNFSFYGGAIAFAGIMTNLRDMPHRKDKMMALFKELADYSKQRTDAFDATRQ